jgi:hypothetical protein
MWANPGDVGTWSTRIDVIERWVYESCGVRFSKRRSKIGGGGVRMGHIHSLAIALSTEYDEEDAVVVRNQCKALSTSQEEEQEEEERDADLTRGVCPVSFVLHSVARLLRRTILYNTKNAALTGDRLRQSYECQLAMHCIKTSLDKLHGENESSRREHSVRFLERLLNLVVTGTGVTNEECPLLRNIIVIMMSCNLSFLIAGPPKEPHRYACQSLHDPDALAAVIDVTLPSPFNTALPSRDIASFLERIVMVEWRRFRNGDTDYLPSFTYAHWLVFDDDDVDGYTKISKIS